MPRSLRGEGFGGTNQSRRGIRTACAGFLAHCVSPCRLEQPLLRFDLPPNLYARKLPHGRDRSVGSATGRSIRPLPLAAKVVKRLVVNFRVLPEAGEPVDLRVAAKPGELALGVATRGALDGDVRLVKLQLSLKHRAEFSITNEVEGLGVWR